MKIKRIMSIILVLVFVVAAFAGCGTNGNNGKGTENEKKAVINYKKLTRYNSDNVIEYVEDRELDKDGLVTKETVYRLSDDNRLYLDTITESEYNADGLVTSYKYYSTDDGEVEAYLYIEYKYEYENGVMSKQESFYLRDGEMKNTDYTVYKRDAAKRTTEAEYYELAEDGSFELASVSEYTYQGDFDTAEKVEYFSINGEEKSLVYSNVNTLDDKGRTVESITESEFIHMREVTEYSGDTKSKDIAYVKDKPEDEWEQRYTYSYTYNNDGKLIETVSDYPNGDVEKIVNEFADGKLAKSTEYAKDFGTADFVILSYELYEY